MNSQQLQDKVIIITGAAGQLGLTSVKMFLDRGAKIVANDIVDIAQSPQLQKIQEQYSEDRFYFIQADISREEQVKQAYEEIDRKFGRLDGLFHNAYKQIAKPVIDLTLQEWNDVMTGSLTSTFLVCKYAVLSMLKSGGGSIVNTSSIISTEVFRKKANAAYGTAKAGLNQFTRILAVEYADRGIRANVVIPASLSTTEKVKEMKPEKLRRVRERVPLGRYGTTDDVAELAAFLLSDASSYITSSLYHIDGGYGL